MRSGKGIEAICAILLRIRAQEIANSHNQSCIESYGEEVDSSTSERNTELSMAKVDCTPYRDDSRG